MKQLQTDLKTLGYDPGTIDGVYGTSTVKAVKLFQTDAKLTVDGIAGMARQSAIEVALDAKKAADKKKTEPKADTKAEAKKRIREYLDKIAEEMEKL